MGLGLQDHVIGYFGGAPTGSSPGCMVRTGLVERLRCGSAGGRLPRRGGRRQWT